MQATGIYTSFALQDGNRLLGGFFHEKTHLRMRGRDVGIQSEFLQRLVVVGPIDAIAIRFSAARSGCSSPASAATRKRWLI